MGSRKSGLSGKTRHILTVPNTWHELQSSRLYLLLDIYDLVRRGHGCILVADDTPSCDVVADWHRPFGLSIEKFGDGSCIHSSTADIVVSAPDVLNQSARPGQAADCTDHVTHLKSVFLSGATPEAGILKDWLSTFGLSVTTIADSDARTWIDENRRARSLITCRHIEPAQAVFVLIGANADQIPLALLALANGLDVVASDSRLVAAHLPDLLSAAALGQSRFRFASCLGGSAPILEIIRLARYASAINRIEARLKDDLIAQTDSLPGKEFLTEGPLSAKMRLMAFTGFGTLLGPVRIPVERFDLIATGQEQPIAVVERSGSTIGKPSSRFPSYWISN